MVFGFTAAAPAFFFKPFVARKAAGQYGFVLGYDSGPQWTAYSRVLAFAKRSS
jgi:hypothetical protein